MRSALLLVAILFGAPLAKAEPNLNAGDWELGGAFNLSRTSERSPYFASTDRTRFTLNLNAQNFVADEFSVGLEAGYSTAGSRSGVAYLGPVATKYLWVDDKLAPYISMLPIRWTKAEGVPADFSTTVRIGGKYFLTDSVAVGPAVDFTHDWGREQNPERNTWSFLGLFSIHL